MLFRIKNQFIAHVSPDSWWYKASKPLYLKIKQLWYSLAKSSVFADESKLKYCSLYPREILTATVKMFAPKSVLDVGCGTGKSLGFFVEQGIEAVGIEASQIAIDASEHRSRIIKANLKREVNLHRKFDLVWCFEVAEHIHADYAGNLIRTFSNHADLIVMSAARPGQGGEGHLNEQPPEYWVEKCADCGFRLNQDATAALQRIHDTFSENLLVFTRDA